jgi:hypothetical protein
MPVGNKRGEAYPVVEKERLAPATGEATEHIEEGLSSPMDETTSVPEADPVVEVRELPARSEEEVPSVAEKELPALVESEAAPTVDEKEVPAAAEEEAPNQAEATPVVDDKELLAAAEKAPVESEAPVAVDEKDLPAPVEAEAAPGVDEKELSAPIAEEAPAELEAAPVVEEKDAPAVEVKCLAAEVEVEKVAKVKVVKEKAVKESKEKVPKPAALHPSYLVMIVEAIGALKEQTGSNQYAIAKYLEDKYKDALPANFKKHLTVQLRNLTKAEKLVKVKNSFKLSDELKKPAAGRKPPTVREAVMPKKGLKTVKAVGAKAKATKPRRTRSQRERPL